MLTPVLIEPPPRQPVGRPRRRWSLLIGWLLVALGLLGAFTWVWGFTPVGYARLGLGRDQTVTDIRVPGTYLVFEERRGAATPSLPPPVAIAVTSDRGDVVDIERLVKPGQVASPLAYTSPWYEGRALARFTITESGAYHVRALPVNRAQPTEYEARVGSRIAIGREESTTWWGTWVGAMVLVGVPIAAGVGVLVWSRRRRPATAGGGERFR